MADQKISAMNIISSLIGTYKIPLDQQEATVGNYATNLNQLEAYFQASFSDNFWPLGGTADLSAAVTIDGNGHDLIFGSPNQLDEFNILATTGIHLHVDDGSSHIHALFNSTGLEMISDDGVNSSQLDLNPTLQSFNTTGSIGWTCAGVLNFTADDGVNSSDFTLQPDLFSLSITGDINLVSDNFSVAKATGMSVLADDGVDSSTFNLTPVGHEFTGSFAHTEISPAQITANQNNYDPGPGVWFNLTSDASRNITGWVPQIADGDEFTAYNGGSFDIVFTHNDTGNSTAANCFSVPGGASFTLDAGKSVTWKYSAAQSRWRLISTTV